MKLTNIDDSPFESWVEERDTYKRFTSRKKKRIITDDFCAGPAWKSLRQRVLAEYGRVCMKCQEDKCVIQVDHIRPKSLHPELSYDFNNMQVLCEPCNLDKGVTTEDFRPKWAKVKYPLPLTKGFW